MSRRENKPSKNIKWVCIISQNTRGLELDKKYKKFVKRIKRRNLFAVCLHKTWPTSISTLENENSIEFNSRLDQNHVKSRRLEQTLRILLSEYAVTAWRSTQFIVYNDIRARIIVVHLLKTTWTMKLETFWYHYML